MSARDRDRRPGRRRPFLNGRKRLLIVCEGEGTETQYFEQFAAYHRRSLVNVEVAREHDKALVAVKIAKRLKARARAAARAQADPSLAYDQVWCVFDRDEHPLSDEAFVMSRANGIKIAPSNPCLESWLILHLRDSPGAKHRHAMQRMLKGLVDGYEKDVELDRFQHGYEQAVARARRLDRRAEEVGESGRNPTTSVYKLTEAIVPPRPSPPGPTPGIQERHSR